VAKRYVLALAVLCAGVAVGQELLDDTDEIKTLTVEMAHALAQHKGQLSLDGLTTISDAAVKALAQHEGPLELGGLTTLSDEAAKALAQHKGPLYLSSRTTLSDEAAAELRSNPEIHLPAKFKR
jgi:hypothetical protein